MFGTNEGNRDFVLLSDRDLDAVSGGEAVAPAGQTTICRNDHCVVIPKGTLLDAFFNGYFDGLGK